MSNWGTIYQCDGKKAVLHKVPQAEFETVCGIDLYDRIPAKWPTHKHGWNIFPGGLPTTRCKKCFPNQRKGRTWPKDKK